jgi:DNA-binding PadR family transcriptional regulator
MNAEQFTPVDRTDHLLQRLCKEGYLVKNREMDGGDEIIEYMVGPRGKIEVGARGVAGLVREVYGRQAMIEDDDVTPAEREKIEEFEFRLANSLGFRKPNGRAADGEQNADDESVGEDRPTQRRRRRAPSEEDSDA